ncbi:MAG: hypothetical protein ACLR23_14605 [Clostridia bacterium]
MTSQEPVRSLAPLFAQNSDCIGWLSIPDTQLNYPVMYTPESPQKYLRRNFDGGNQSGIPFLTTGAIRLHQPHDLMGII